MWLSRGNGEINNRNPQHRHGILPSRYVGSDLRQRDSLSWLELLERLAVANAGCLMYRGMPRTDNC